jgi:hypothetical protein
MHVLRIVFICFVLVLLTGAKPSSKEAAWSADEAADFDTGDLDTGRTAHTAFVLGSWRAGLTLEPIDVIEVDGVTYQSSTRLKMTWKAFPGTPHHYEVVVEHPFDNVSDIRVIAFSNTMSILDELKSETDYTVTLYACKTITCNQAYVSRTSPSASTAREVWQLDGSNNGFDNATVLFENGNSLPYVFEYGPGSGYLEGELRLNWGAKHFAGQGGGMRSVRGDNSDFTSFDGADYSHSLHAICADDDACEFMISGTQSVPLLSNTIRTYMEATDKLTTGSPTRIYSIDSTDGYVGLKYNSDPTDDTPCGVDSSDYGPGGACELKLVIGITGDPGVPDSGLTQARQFKIGFPKQDSWRWDQSPGTFMVLTGASQLASPSTCTSIIDGLFYAVYDGADWEVLKDTSGCPLALHEGAHGPVIDHRGDAKYALYYEEHPYASGGELEEATEYTEGMDPVWKPFKVIYGNGAASGDANSVDFGDWESRESARNVDFLWPDGTVLSDEDEATLGDHVIVRPIASLETRYMYMNVGGSTGSFGTGFAVHINR